MASDCRKYPFERKGHDGTCSWCGGGIVYRKGHKREGQPDNRRSWHDGRDDEQDCFHEYCLRTRRDSQYRFLVGRDGEKCKTCGETPYRWLRERWETVSYEIASQCRKEGHGYGWGRFISVQWVVALEVEHITPLWSVAHLSDEERRPFFGPDNLELSCPKCHKIKSKAEAAERAKVKAMGGPIVYVTKDTVFPASAGQREVDQL